MGMVGCYSAHFYCDACRLFQEADQVDTAGQARTQMREAGWRFERNGDVLCPKCKPSDVSLNGRRDGGDWHNYP